MLVMVTFVFVPRRLWSVQLGAVLAWAAMWQDNQLTGHWVDLTGVVVVVACVLVWLSAAGRAAARARE